MAAIVHDPSTLISGVLTDSASGSTNIYFDGWSGGGTSSLGQKLNSATLGISGAYKWGAEDANFLGHLFTDVVNLGTVPLFSSATAISSAFYATSASLLSSGTKWDTASSSFSATQVSFTALSMSVVGHEGWAISGTGTYTGSIAADYTGSRWTMSGALMNALWRASSSLGTALGLQGSLLTVQNSSSNYSSSLYGSGPGPNYTGSLAPWVSGAMQTLIDLSSTFYGQDFPGGLIRSASVQDLSWIVLGTRDLNAVVSGNYPSSGSYPTGTIFDLRTTHYAMSAAFWPTSASYWPLSAAFSATKLMTDALSASYNLSATSVWNPLSSSYYTLSGNLNSSASIWNANTTGALSTSFYTLSGNLNSSASIWNAASASYYTLSGNLNSSASTWNAAAAAVVGVAHLTSANWLPDGGFFSVSGAVEATGAFISRVVPSISGILPGFVASGASGGEHSGTSFAFSSSAGYTHIISKTTGRVHLMSDSPSFGVRSVNYDELTLTSGAWAQGVFDFDTSLNRGQGQSHVILSTQFGRVKLSDFGTLFHSSSCPGPLGELGIVIRSETGDINFLPAPLSGVHVVATPGSGTHAFGRGALSVDTDWDGIQIRTSTPNANFLETWNGSNLVGYWDVLGEIYTSGSIVTFGAVSASGGFNAGNAKITSVAAGSVTSDAVNYGQFQPVSASLVVLSQSMLLSVDPWVSSQYTASYTGGLLQSEVWKGFGGALIKSSSYAYTGTLLSQSFVSVFDAAGTTIVAQTTSSYFYSGTALLSATVSRSI